jgi:hypothetical protein
VVTYGEFDLILNTRDISDSGKFVAPYEISFFIDGVKLYGLKFDRFTWEDNNQLGFVYDMEYSNPGNFFFNIFSQTGFTLERGKTDMDDVFDGLAPGDHECKVQVSDNFGNVSTGLFSLCKVEKPVVEFSDIFCEPKRLTLNVLNLSAAMADKILIRLLDEYHHLLYTGELNQTMVKENGKLVLEGVSSDMVRIMEFSFVRHGIEYDIKKVALNEDDPVLSPDIHFRAFANRDLIFIKIDKNDSPPAGLALEVIQGGMLHSVSAVDGKDFTFFCFRPSGIENDIQLKFIDKKNRPLWPDEPKKLQIIHLLMGIEQRFVDGEFTASFASGTVREPKVLVFETRNFNSPFPVESRQISLAPYHFPFLDAVVYSFKKDLPDPQQVGIFRYNYGRKRWRYVSTSYDPEKRRFESRLISSGTFALMRDVFPPVISMAKPGSVFRTRIGKITVIITDQGKGVDDNSLEVWVNRNKIPDCEYDPDWRQVQIRDLGFLKTGENLLRVDVKDFGGNRSSRTFRLFLK